MDISFGSAEAPAWVVALQALAGLAGAVAALVTTWTAFRAIRLSAEERAERRVSTRRTQQVKLRVLMMRLAEFYYAKNDRISSSSDYSDQRALVTDIETFVQENPETAGPLMGPLVELRTVLAVVGVKKASIEPPWLKLCELAGTFQAE